MPSTSSTTTSAPTTTADPLNESADDNGVFIDFPPTNVVWRNNADTQTFQFDAAVDIRLVAEPDRAIEVYCGRTITVDAENSDIQMEFPGEPEELIIFRVLGPNELVLTAPPDTCFADGSKELRVTRDESVALALLGNTIDFVSYFCPPNARFLIDAGPSEILNGFHYFRNVDIYGNWVITRYLIGGTAQARAQAVTNPTILDISAAWEEKENLVYL